jgi:molybdenum-dependent DNA-binding transcriptional regulator ModE
MRPAGLARFGGLVGTNRLRLLNALDSAVRSRGTAKPPAADNHEPVMIDLNSLAIFAKVVETRSFSEAAKRLNMPISTVSRRVAELEDQLGVGLLERSTRSLRLTDVGAEVFEHAQRSAEISEAVGNIVSN